RPVNVTSSLNTIRLQFNNLISGTYIISAEQVEGINGSLTQSPISKTFNYIKPYQAKPNDIVINEIFADPSPQIDLPSTEFVELWNTTQETISLKGYKYGDLTSSFVFGDEYIYPNEHLILCAKNDTTEYKKYGRAIGISPWPSLNNASDLLTLSSANETIIHSANYFDWWYRDPQKKNGGYTLELINPLSSCITSQNYTGSNDISGGTPGRQNSVYSTSSGGNKPKILSAEILDNHTLQVLFDNSVDSLQASLTTHYSVNKGMGTPAQVVIAALDYTKATLYFNAAFTKESAYTLDANGVSNCNNQLMDPQLVELVFPGSMGMKDILISEVLFNPRAGGSDFVEVYNNSNKTLNFRDLFLASVDDKDSIINIRNVSNSSILFEPGTYWALSADPENIKNEYFTTAPNNFIKMNSLPAYNDNAGVVLLLNADQERIDQLNYNSKMHFPLLKDVEGVSLERSSFSEDANKPGNFRSATATVGYATPAYKNSQQTISETPNVQGISLSKKVFTPDNDGQDDVLNIFYQFDQSEYVANVRIYNEQGRLVRKLVNNELLGISGSWLWDGFDDVQQPAKTGIYIVYTELFDLAGKSKRYKTAFSLIAGK
ncbi:lamin tail domain-containing protein, partial [Pseudoxanthomonas sp. SGD-10]